jgi:hypothetical protein
VPSSSHYDKYDLEMLPVCLITNEQAVYEGINPLAHGPVIPDISLPKVACGLEGKPKCTFDCEANAPHTNHLPSWLMHAIPYFVCFEVSHKTNF